MENPQVTRGNARNALNAVTRLLSELPRDHGFAGEVASLEAAQYALRSILADAEAAVKAERAA